MKTLVLLFAVLAVAYGSKYNSQGQQAIHKPVTLPGQRHHAVPLPGQINRPNSQGGYNGGRNQGFSNGYQRPAGGLSRPLIPNQHVNQHHGNIQQRPAGGYGTYGRPDNVPSYSGRGK